MHSMTIMLGKHEQTAKWIKMTSCQGVHRVSPTSVVCTDVCPSNVALASRRCSRSLWRILWDYIVFNMLCWTMCHSVAHSSPCYLFSDATVYGCFRLSWANMQKKSRVEKIGRARIDTGCVLSLWEKIKIHMSYALYNWCYLLSCAFCGGFQPHKLPIPLQKKPVWMQFTENFSGKEPIVEGPKQALSVLWSTLRVYWLPLCHHASIMQSLKHHVLLHVPMKMHVHAPPARAQCVCVCTFPSVLCCTTV